MFFHWGNELALVRSQQTGEGARIQKLDNTEALGNPLRPARSPPLGKPHSQTVWKTWFIYPIHQARRTKSHKERGNRHDSSSAKLLPGGFTSARTGPGSRVSHFSAEKSATVRCQVRSTTEQSSRNPAGTWPGLPLKIEISRQKCDCQALHERQK